jgi:VanZ family protein
MTRPATFGWALATAAVSVLYLVVGLLPTVPEPLRSVSDDLLHAGAYALLSFLVAMTVQALQWPRPVLLGACYAVGHGALLEALQYFDPPRAAELSDLAADAVGACLGALVAWLVLRRRP